MASFAGGAFDLVAVGEGGREPGGDLGHGAKMDRRWGIGEADRTRAGLGKSKRAGTYPRGTGYLLGPIGVARRDPEIRRP